MSKFPKTSSMSNWSKEKSEKSESQRVLEQADRECMCDILKVSGKMLFLTLKVRIYGEKLVVKVKYTQICLKLSIKACSQAH